MNKRTYYRVEEPIAGEWHVKMVTPAIGRDIYLQTVAKCTDKAEADRKAAALNWRIQEAYHGR